MHHETDPRHRPRSSKGHTSRPVEFTQNTPQNPAQSKTTPRSRTGRKPTKRTDERRRLGAEGENRAAWFLRRRGYRILSHNVRIDGVELDLIVQRGPLVAFVEVKTRRSSRFGSPEQAVDAAKQARIVRGAAGWLRAHPGAAGKVRFDVVSCRVRMEYGREAWLITHLTDAFRPGD